MVTATLRQPTAPTAVGPRATAIALSAALTLHALATIAQPVLIGGYLDGGFDLLVAHGAVGSALVPSLCLLALAAAVLRWGPGRGSGWPVPVLAVLFLAEGAQIAAGFTRVLALHVPLGVSIVATSCALAVWSWRRSARRPRAGWFA